MITSPLFFGLGRIGLPQSLVFANAGLNVYGYDVQAEVVESLEAGSLPFFEPGMEEMFHATKNKSFFPVKSWEDILSNVDAVFFTLGTGAPDAQTCLTDEEGDIEHIKKLLVQLVTHPACKKGLLLAFRTTLFLGSTDRLKAHVESSTGLKEGVDFHICFIPERLMEGAAIREEQTLPKIIGAFNDTGFALAKSIFDRVGGKIVRVPNPRTAEFCKLTDNSYRNTMFAFANELAIWASRNDVDVQEVLRANNAEYERNNIPRPGFVSGYCLGKDPYIFEYGFNKQLPQREFQSLWYYGRRTNDFLIDFAVEEVCKALTDSGRSLSSAKCAILGLSFKEDVDDFRMSHAFPLIDALQEQGIRQITGYDPALGSCKYTQIPAKYTGEQYHWVSGLEAKDFAGMDAIIIAHRHASIRSMQREDIQKLLKHCQKPVIVFDGWNVWRNASDIDGVQYMALGYSGNGAKDAKKADMPSKEVEAA